jgi:hypothetical protein
MLRNEEIATCMSKSNVKIVYILLEMWLVQKYDFINYSNGL